jgi:hypothetical protein
MPSRLAPPTIVVVKTANETVNNSATLQDDNHLSFHLPANGQWIFDASIKWSSGATPDLKLDWTLPSGTTGRYGVVGDQAQGTPDAQLDMAGTNVFPGGSGNFSTYLAGEITMGSAAGLVTLQWAQNTANASDTILQKGSWVRVMRAA